MLQLPDFKEKQIVFIGLNGLEALNSLKVKNENLVVYDKFGDLVNQVSCSKIFAVFVVGTFTISSTLIKKLLSYGISLTMISKGNFKVYAEIGVMAEGNYLLRANQYQFSEHLELSRRLLFNKISNQFMLLKELTPAFFVKKSRLQQLKDIKVKINNAKTIAELMGIEGAISRAYFKILFKQHGWYKRLPRTKIDVNNLLLDIGYTLLFNFVDNLLRLHGFDTYKGIYHQLFFQRKSLTCDLIEPFRCIIDKALIKAYNLKQIKGDSFKKTKTGYLLKPDQQKLYIKIFAEAIMDRKEDIFKYVKAHYFSVLNQTDEYKAFNYKK